MHLLIVIVAAVIATIIGVAVGSGMNFRNFGGSGLAIIGSSLTLIAGVTLAACATGALSVVGVVVTALVGGILIRGAGK